MYKAKIKVQMDEVVSAEVIEAATEAQITEADAWIAEADAEAAYLGAEVWMSKAKKLKLKWTRPRLLSNGCGKTES